MNKLFYKLLTVLALSMMVSLQVSAKTVEQKTLTFPIKADELLKGEVHYFFEILSPSRLAVQYSELYDLDSLSLTQESDVMMVVNKTVYIVNKPVGFFDDKQLSDEKYVAHIMGDQKIKKLGTDSYKISVPGPDGYSFKMQSFYDADDVSTLPNSKVTRGVTAVKKLDVISKGASTIMFTEKTNFTRYTEGGVSVSSFIPLNEKKTLVITYNLWAVQKKYVDQKSLKESYLEEAQSVKSLQDSFK